MLKDAMHRFFDRVSAAYAAAGQAQRAERDPAAGPEVFVGSADEEGLTEWRLREKSTRHDLAALAPDLGVLHSSLEEYFNSWWFCTLEGGFGEYGITLKPVVPGIEFESFLRDVRNYRAAHGGRLEHVPLGIEFNGLLVVLDNVSGEVDIEDWERGTFTPIAPSLEALFEGMKP